MPATRERIYLLPDQDSQPAHRLDFPLWRDRSAFFKIYGERQIDTGSPFYVDYGLLLTGGEAIAWDRRCREQFAGDPRSREAFILEAMRQMEPLLSQARWVIVESYEWESGLS